MIDAMPPGRPASYDKKVALALQGGGALGSYQAGVHEALASSEYVPDWVAGISIGALFPNIFAIALSGAANVTRAQAVKLLDDVCSWLSFSGRTNTRGTP